MTNITVRTPIIKLDSFLKFSGACSTGGYAKEVVQAGQVLVNDEVCTMRGKKLKNGDTIQFMNEVYKVVYSEPSGT